MTDISRNTVGQIDWNQYPNGTKAYAINGGHWIKNNRGWKWCTGATFPTLGGDCFKIELPQGSTRAGDKDE